MEESIERKRIQEEQQKMVCSLIRVLSLQLGELDYPTEEMKKNAVLALKLGYSLNKEQMGILSQVLEEGDLANCANEIRGCILSSNSKLNPKRVDLNGRIVEDILY